MASPYDWGVAQPPTATVDGQLHVDDLLRVWEWSQATATWNRKQGYDFAKVRSLHLLISGVSVANDVFQYGRRTAEFGTLWDEAFKLAFVEVTDRWTGAVLGRRAHMTKAELMLWLPTVVPVSGGRYNSDPVLHVYEVINPALNATRINAWNGLYGSFRGRDCYIGSNGFGRPGLPPRAGYCDEFASYHGTNLDLRLVQYFFGAVPATSERRVCWMANNKRSLYRFPVQTGRIIINPSPGTGRYVYNTVTLAWEPCPAGSEFEFYRGREPAFIYRTPDGVTLTVTNPPDATLGLEAVFGEGWEGREMMVAYPVRDASAPTKVAFHIKPYGITKAAMVFGLEVTLANYDAVVVGKFDAQPRDDVFYVPTVVSGWVEQREAGDGIRFGKLLNIIAQLTRPRQNGVPENTSLDSACTPDRVHFYVRHKQTGLRGEYSRAHIAALRRKNTIPFCYILNHA